MKNLWNFICILGLLLKLLFVLLERTVTGMVIRHFKNKELLEIGTQLTFYYFLIFLIFFGYKLPELYNDKIGINGVGDFLAGLFSPIAFGWLIIGYLMQNKELKNNNNALNLQVENYEKNLIIAKDNIKFQKELNLLERKEKLTNSSIKLSKIKINTNKNNYYILEALNIGQEAKEVNFVNHKNQPFPTSLNRLEKWRKDERLEVDLKIKHDSQRFEKLVREMNEERGEIQGTPFDFINDEYTIQYYDTRGIPRSLPLVLQHMYFGDGAVSTFAETMDETELTSSLKSENPWL